MSFLIVRDSFLTTRDMEFPHWQIRMLRRWLLCVLLGIPKQSRKDAVIGWKPKGVE